MVNTYKLRLSKIKKGADNTADLAILQTQLMLSKTWLRPTRTRMERIQKFLDINDSLDALDSLIVGKRNLGLVEWIAEHKKVKQLLAIPNLAYYDIEKFRWLIKRRYDLYNIVLQSLGYYTKEIVRNEAYDEQEGSELMIDGL
jgi:hypothetical protein